MKTKTGKILLSIAALFFSGLSACLGMGLLGGSGLGFAIRVAWGACFLWSPLLVLALIMTLFRKGTNDFIVKDQNGRKDDVYE